MRRVLAISAWNLLAAGLLVATLEVLARTCSGEAPRPLFDDPDRFVRDREFVIPHPVRGFALRPDFQSERYTVDAAGFRGAGPAAEPSPRTLLTLGDSTIFGWQVADTETWPHQLERFLAESGRDDLGVVNAGVPSYTSPQVLLYLQELLPRLAPRVVLVGVLWNDVWYSTLDPWFPEALTRGQPQPWQRWLYERSALFRWRLRGSGGEVDVLNQRALDHYRDNLRAMVNACREAGARLAFVAPTLDLSQVDDSLGPLGSPIGQGYLSKAFVLEIGWRYQEVLEQVAERHGAAVIEHRLSLRRPNQPRLFLDFIHPRPQGHRMIAEDVGRFLLAEGWL